MDVHDSAARCRELSMRYWQAAGAGLPTGELFQQLVGHGRRALTARRESDPSAAIPCTEADIAGVLLDAYGRELTTHQAGGWTYRQVKAHWATAEEFTPFVGADKLRHYLSGKAQYELGEGRASEALALVDEARQLPREPASGTMADYAHGDLRALRAAALHQLYDSDTALDVLAPLEAELSAHLPDGPLLATDDEAVRRLEEEFVRGRGGAVPLARLLEASAVYHQILDTKAGALRDVGRPAEAEKAYLMLMPHYTASGLPEVGHIQLARVALDQGATQRANQWLDLAAPLFETPVESDRTSMRAHLRLVRGAAYCRMRAEAARQFGHHRSALTWCDRGETFLAARRDDSLNATLQTERARAHRALGNPARAANAYQQAAFALDRVLRVPLGHRFDTLHLRFRRPVFEEALAAAEETGHARLAAVVTDLLKARAFSARLSLARSAEPDQPDDPDRTRFAELTEAIARTDRQGRPHEAHRLYEQRAALLIKIRAVDPRWHLIRDDPPFDPATLTGYLAAYGDDAPGSGGRCVALSLYERPGGVLALLATPDGCLRMGTRGLAKGTRRALDAYERMLGEPEQAAEELDFWSCNRIGLADLVPEAFADEVAASGTCLLSPHGRLHALPWTVVRHRGRHLVRGTALGIVPNLSCIPALDHRPQAPLQVALLGVPEPPDGSPPLPQIRQLVRLLSDLLGPDRLFGEPLVGRDADAAALRALLDSGPPLPDRTAVLQIATHGIRNPGSPFRASVQMTDGEVETGEILMGRMCFEEVVLTACSTSFRAAADLSGGHGALAGPGPRVAKPLELAGDVANALVHAFHEAGAAFVLASPVPVRLRLASHHSLTWFAHRAGGCDPLEAARRAAVGLLDVDDSPRQVGNWAGITAYGAR
ncbi:CHAT domain-containing protein [Streptomyces sp. NBC_01381]|uniref:CHAT domain-containing protein n=1 Tax=Streptomyces sp. NBC_01381 TaxID=2903845 RepID=UPI002252D796|nr:CHAT domain-containing protein [Streptomyces sp. NBC_01381]MCX4671954.1 CHAT domain-containing protein [Streptomyces sp. NBC_01381]